MSIASYNRKLPIAFADLPSYPAGLAPDSVAARLYASVAPLASEDPTVGWSLLILCNALGAMFQLVEDWTRDTTAGPGWSLLLDLDRCPDEALPWLAQVVGVRVLPNTTPAEQRARIASTDGFKRGTRQALVGAAQATLTGTRTVVFRERDGDPYVLTAITYVDQTPDPTATLNALLAQKPGGIVLNYRTAPGEDYQTLRDSGLTYAQVATTYPDYAAVRDDEPA